jgi:hypothetical protein
MSVGQSSALIVIGTVLRFVLTWQPRHVGLPVIGIVYINFQEFGVILMAGGAGGGDLRRRVLPLPQPPRPAVTRQQPESPGALPRRQLLLADPQSRTRQLLLADLQSRTRQLLLADPQSRTR